MKIVTAIRGGATKGKNPGNGQKPSKQVFGGPNLATKSRTYVYVAEQKEKASRKREDRPKYMNALPEEVDEYEAPQPAANLTAAQSTSLSRVQGAVSAKSVSHTQPRKLSLKRAGSLGSKLSRGNGMAAAVVRARSSEWRWTASGKNASKKATLRNVLAKIWTRSKHQRTDG